MGDIHKTPPLTAESQTVLPDVVHSQQIPAQGTAVTDTETPQIDTPHNVTGTPVINEDDSHSESISEHIPSKMEYSITESENVGGVAQSGLLQVEQQDTDPSRNSSLNMPIPLSPGDIPSTQDPSKSTSWPIDPKSTEVYHISEESPVNLASESVSKATHETLQAELDNSQNDSEPHETPRSDKYLDSLNDETYPKSNPSEDEKEIERPSHSSNDSAPSSLSAGKVSPKQDSSGSEEIIKLDIRGHCAPKFPQSTAKIIFGPPPEGSLFTENIQHPTHPLPTFQTLLSPFLVGAEEMKVEELFNENVESQTNPEDIEKDSLSSDKDKIEQSDLLVEEVTVDYDMKEKTQDESMPSIPQPKSLAPEDTMSFETISTDYKTICEEFQAKLVHLENAITKRDALIEELTVTLQRAIQDKNDLVIENKHLSHEVLNLQQVVTEVSEHDTVKAQLSDYAKYSSMINDTKYYSALMSSGSSAKSSNGEKDNDREEITVNYSKSDLKSSDSEDFQGFEVKITDIINRFDESIEENLRNKLRESLIRVLCDEIGRIRIESDTDVRELETQLRQDKHAFTVETRRLRELLASVKAGNADIDELREELGRKHEKEMENLRTYFEKKCSDMERSYSEEVYRGRACASPQSASSLEPPNEAGDCLRRRTKSAELPSLTAEMPPLEFAIRHSNRRADGQQLEDLKAEHAALVSEMKEQHRLAVTLLQEQIERLKARVQTAENTESNVSLYQQDIDLELEKDAIFERRLEEAKQQVVQHLQEQIQVLLSDPDAELSSWPLELVALRDKIHEARPEKELSSLREEAPGEADKWKQRRQTTFDQNRHLEEVTKERDSFKRVATSLQRIVGQLVAYCAAAEDELNRTVLAELLGRLLPEASLIEDSRPSTPNLDLSVARSKHVHFAPDLSLLAELGSEGVAGFLQGQRDVSIDIKRDLEQSLRRLREEAHELLEAAARVKGKVPSQSQMVETSPVKITELVEQLDARHSGCDNCEMHRRNMEEAMTECLQRENLLRSDLEAALMNVAQLMQAERPDSCDLVVEGYGTGQHQTPTSLPARGPARRAPDSGSVSLDRGSPRVLRASYDALHKERDDLHQQLEAANRQLRSTRSFVEEQAAEREAERDEFARQLDAMRDENGRLAARLHTNATILNEMLNLRINCCNCREHYAHVEQLETQTREMNTLIQDLESRKAAAVEELKATNEKISLLRDIIANLENQLEQKAAHEAVILEQLEEMRKTIDERDDQMRGLLGELESLRSEKAEMSEAASVVEGDERVEELMERIREQSRWLEEKLHRRSRRLERAHETCSAPCSEPSEDVSLRDRRPRLEVVSPGDASPRWGGMPELQGLWEAAEALARAEDAALKRIADLDMQRKQLKDVAQEVRAERDVLQTRMSEQALKISSLSARLETQRNNAEALAHQAAGQLAVSLHDAQAEVQRLKEELESKDKQLLRAKHNIEEKEKLNEQHQALYGNTCNPKDKVLILERELSAAQTRIAQLEALAGGLERERDELLAGLRDRRHALAERDQQLQEIMALKLDEEQKEDEPEGKTSARTLSDIVSISEFDEQDLQMRRAELKAQNLSLSGVPYPDNRDKTQLNRTLPPDLSRPNMSSLNIDFIDHFDLPSFTPRADSLPGHLTSTQNKDTRRIFKRNVNETTVFGTAEKFGDSVKHSTAQNIPDNCSMYPNREVDESKDVSVAPKKIDFSAAPSQDNRSQADEFTSLRELGITLDIRQENFPDILTQLKHEIKKSRTELDTCKSELKNAEEQLCEFPALKEEVEELKGLLENTMATMENDKKFYENQLEHFSSNKTLLEQRVNELSQEVSEKSKDLHLLKEDILRRENMILELAKEKRNLTNKMTELTVKIDELQSRNTSLEKCETENRILKEKISELQKLEQLVSEKNQQIDSLNQHLDRLDDLQRNLADKTEELDNLKEAFEEKSNEVFRLQDLVEAQNRDIDKINEENNNLNINNKELKLKLTKLEKEQENASLKLQNSESELERVNSLNNELTSKIDELKDLTDKLKDKETEIDILNEDINSYHEEIASLKEQMKMVSRSPSPKSKSDQPDRQASNDKKQLAKIRKQISLLQHELDFNRKELNDKAFELAKAKLDVTELRNSLSQANKQAADREQQAEAAEAEKHRLAEQLQAVTERIREESNITELRLKLQEKTDKCQELEAEIQDMKDLVDRLRECGGQSPTEQRALVVSGTRSPTAELERALRDQLDYSHRLDQDIMEQILSGSSDEHEEIPRLALNSSKSSSSIHSTSSERMNRLKSENDKLVLQLNNLEARLKDKDALITELNRIRDKLVQDWQAAKLRLQAEKDSCGRLQLLLLTHKESAQTQQNQDSNMIQILKKRLESAMQSELELQQREIQHKARLATLERQLAPGGQESNQLLQAEQENSERLRGEISLLKSKLEVERTRAADTQALLEHSKTHFQRELDARAEQCHALRNELAELRRLKHDAGVELLRAKELLNIQSGAIRELEQKLATAAQKQRPVTDALTEIESQKTELAREITNLRVLVSSPELSALRDARGELRSQVEALQRELRARTQGADDKDQAIRYLHSRCLKLESRGKALVWQKRYLQRVLAGYAELERGLRPAAGPAPPATPRRFKYVATCVVAVLRMGFLVRRRRQLRALAAHAVLRPRPAAPATPATPATPAGTRDPWTKPSESTPTSRPRPHAKDSLARRVLEHERTPQSPATPPLGDFIRRSYSSISQHEDSFGMSTPRGEASAYLDKLGLVSRRLRRAVDSPRDAP